MPPTSSPAEGGFFKGYNPHAKEFYPTTIDLAETADMTPVGEMIVEVWSDNLETTMEEMSSLVHSGYNQVSMDTEFPGVVAHASAKAYQGSSPAWQTIRVNVNILRVIQIGLTFRDEEGNAPTNRPSIFQVNFKFDLENDMYAVDSINLLKNSGIDFNLLKQKGCDVNKFAELLMSSGLILTDEVTWISFASGYDFAYLIRLLTGQEVPDERAFLELLDMHFPSFYDTKHIARCCDQLQYQGGLDGLASLLDARRVGQAHQAGSDSVVTSNVFFKLLNHYFDNSHKKVGVHRNTLSGLGSGAIAPHRPCEEPQHRVGSSDSEREPHSLM